MESFFFFLAPKEKEKKVWEGERERDHPSTSRKFIFPVQQQTNLKKLAEEI